MSTKESVSLCELASPGRPHHKHMCLWKGKKSCMPSVSLMGQHERYFLLLRKVQHEV